nr:hypothetical protein Iba_chr04dCG18130 [Ipomoea batatas]
MKDAGDYVIGSGSSSYNICSSSEAFVDFSHYAQTEQHFDSSTSSSEEEAEPTSDGEDQRIPQNVSLQRVFTLDYYRMCYAGDLYPVPTEQHHWNSRKSCKGLGSDAWANEDAKATTAMVKTMNLIAISKIF